MSLTQADIKKVSLLARLDLSAEELETMTAQLAKIVGFVEQLAEVDTESVEPMAHALEVSNVFRDDAVRPSVARDEMLAGAPHHDDKFFLVPPVLGE
ncbi:MAG: Asp-tRNA(Asn)/Glu-tRNA(Gln) amidotransferase subunit GatC [Planctomycetes bacterium]|nr:Asp-tRNA(Asn)/Glu-tRNA(Gln) amidotransferase subunit GatC [Planctomycetota bacterium]